jgi:EAL domain-containing protein (putative c-di-GMP-specific phosphodiesterase class I)
LPLAPHRLLGLAFASADLLVELDATTKIIFAVGDAGVIAAEGERSLIGRFLNEFVDARDTDLVWALLAGAETGSRQGPVTVRLDRPGPELGLAFALSLCRLPQNEGVVSCALTRAAPPIAGKLEGGLHDRATFEAVTRSLFETARASGQALELSFIEMNGLAEIEAALPDESKAELRGKVGAALRAHAHGGAAARLESERYALVRTGGSDSDHFPRKLGRLLALSAELSDVTLAARCLPLKGEVSPSQVARALRYALDDFSTSGLDEDVPANLQEAVTRSVRRTLDKATELGGLVLERRFKLVYQPVVNLKSGGLQHHEVLVRFGDDESPFPMIRVAEELDLIEDLDLAIAQRAAAELAADEGLKLAVNISGRTITSPVFVSEVSRLLTGKPTLQRRLIFEITETAAIDDLALANQHVGRLKDLGCLICLDDFGAGAASLSYLQQLSLDVVKIDGRYVREAHHEREAAFLKRLVKMCADMKVKTLAEMVETPQVEDAVRRAGVDFAQGYLYGAPAERPTAPIKRIGPVAARRMGAVESWG